MIRRFLSCRSFSSRCLSFRCGVLGGVLALSALTFLAIPRVLAQSSSSLDFGNQLEYRAQNTNQYPGSGGGGYGQGGYKQYPQYGEPSFHHLALEVGAGFNAPLANTGKVQTYGWNVTLGGGWNFSKRLGLLVEYQFNRTGIPNSVLAAQGAPQGNVHIWSFTLDPIYYYKTGGGWGGYVTGGGGFYRKLTSFTATVQNGFYCDFYGFCFPNYQTLTLSHFSSNQGGVNIGTGITHNIGESGTKLYAEARYTFVDSPASGPSHVGSGTVSMIPVSFGVRW
jgi:hypothetical protein